MLWALADDLGSVRDVARLDPATGTAAVVDHLTYDGFGQVLSETAAAFSPPAKYTGKYVDPLTGLQWRTCTAGTTPAPEPGPPATRSASPPGTPTSPGTSGTRPTNAVDPDGLKTVKHGEEGPWEQFVPFHEVWVVELDARERQKIAELRTLIGKLRGQLAALPAPSGTGSACDRPGAAAAKAKIGDAIRAAEDYIAAIEAYDPTTDERVVNAGFGFVRAGT